MVLVIKEITGNVRLFRSFYLAFIFKPCHIRRWSYTHTVDMVMKTTNAFKHLRVCYKS